MKESTKKASRGDVVIFAAAEHQKIMKNRENLEEEQDDGKDLSKLSKILLALATLKEKTKFANVLKDMEVILKARGNSQFKPGEELLQLPMLGRIALALKLAGETEKLGLIKERLSAQLSKDDDKSTQKGFAFAYLASLDDTSYSQYKSETFNATSYAQGVYNNDPKREVNDYILMLVLGLSAAAKGGDKRNYDLFLDELKKVSPKNSLKDTLLLVPKYESPQWLVSMVRHSLTLAGDKKGLQELESITAPVMDGLDSMLARANDLLSESVAQKASKVAPQFEASTTNMKHAHNQDTIETKIKGEIARLKASTSTAGGWGIKKGFIIASDAKIAALEDLLAIIKNPGNDPAEFQSALLTWKEDNGEDISKQRNRAHALFSPSHVPTTQKMVNEVFGLLGLSDKPKPEKSVTPKNP